MATIQMTRAEYEKKYGVKPQVPALATPAPATTAPIKMTRAEYESKYGTAVDATAPAPTLKSRVDAMAESLKNAPNETMQDIKQIGTGFKQDVGERFKKIDEIGKASSAGEQGNVRGFLQTAGQIAGIGADTITGLLKGAVKAILPQKGEDIVKGAIETVSKPIVESGTVQGLITKYEELKKNDPKAARDIDAILGVGDLASNFLGLTAAKGTAVAAKEGAKATVEAGLKATPKLLSYTSDVPEAAFKILSERNPTVKTAIKEGTTPVQALQQTRQAVRDFRKTLSAEWDEGVQNIVKENEGVRFGLGDNLVNKIGKISDEFGIELPQNLKNISANETINLLKKINELPSAMLTFSPKGALVREVKTALKDAAIKTFGGDSGSFSGLYSNYSSKKGVLDAANDIVNAYAEGKPIKDSTALARLTKIFDENKPAYLDAIIDLEKATGQDLLSGITSTKFAKMTPTVKTLGGGITEKALRLLLIPLTSPRAAQWIQNNVEGAVKGVKDFIKEPKLGASVKIGKQTFNEIPDATKKEMIKVIDYLRIGKTERIGNAEKGIEKTLSDLAQKYNISEDLPSAKIADKFEELIENTKTK